MAKSRRKAGGATAGRYKPKKMGKGWSAYRTKLGFRPPIITKEEAAEAKDTKESEEPAGDAE